MKRKRIILAVGVCVLVLVVAGFALWPKETEPMYQGKSLSEWAEINFAHTLATKAQPADAAASALQAIGTNALPYLLRWIQYQPGALQLRADWFAGKFPFTSQTRVIRWLRGDKDQMRAWSAPEVFAALREKVLPQLLN